MLALLQIVNTLLDSQASVTEHLLDALAEDSYQHNQQNESQDIRQSETDCQPTGSHLNTALSTDNIEYQSIMPVVYEEDDSGLDSLESVEPKTSHVEALPLTSQTIYLLVRLFHVSEVRFLRFMQVKEVRPLSYHLQRGLPPDGCTCKNCENGYKDSRNSH